jgi:cephalosporin hydroxylase
MVITIDIQRKSLSVSEMGKTAEHDLYGADAYSILSREWLKLGWNLAHYQSVSWMGRQLLQLPDDALRIAELIWRLRPEVIVETGTYEGGSAIWFASLCRLMGHGRVISVDCRIRPGVREAIEAHTAGLVTLIEKDSSAPETAATIRAMIQGHERVLVFLDSDHSRKHVEAELRNFAPLVSPGSYLIVADSNLSELADLPCGEAAWRSDNPAVAVEAFLQTHPEFRRDRPAPQCQGAVDFSEISYFPNTWLILVGGHSRGT